MRKEQVLDKFCVNGKILAKDRKQLAEIINECKNNGIQYKVSRSLVEGYRYIVEEVLTQHNPKDFFTVSIRRMELWGKMDGESLYVPVEEIKELYSGNSLNVALNKMSSWKDSYTKLIENLYDCSESSDYFKNLLNLIYFQLYVDEYLYTDEDGKDVYGDELILLEEISAYELYANDHILQPMEIEESKIVESVEDFFKDSKIRRDGSLIKMYHGTTDEFDEFRDSDDFIWAAANKSYAETFSLNKGIVKEVYVNVTNPFVVGYTNEPFEDIMRWVSDDYEKVIPSKHVKEIAEKLNIPVEKLIEIADTIDPSIERHRRRLYQVVNKPEFKKIIMDAGYDGIICKEPQLTVGAIRPNQLKYVTNDNPTLSNKLNEEVGDDEIFFSELPLDAFYKINSSGILFRTSDNETFDSVPNIKDIVLPRDVRIIGSSVFEFNRNMKTFSVEEGSKLSKVGSRAFANCENLTSVVLPETLSRIELSAFVGCDNLKNIDIKSTEYSIASGAFESCVRLEYIDISGDTIIPTFCFSGCSSLKKVKVSDKLTKIDNYAFEGCHSLEGMILPETMESIGNNAFKGCENMKYIVIPEGWKDISYTAFSGCDSLSIYFCSNDRDEILYHLLKDAFKCYFKDEWKYVNGIPEPIKSIKEDIENDEVEFIPLPIPTLDPGESEIKEMLENMGLTNIEFVQPIYKQRQDVIWFDGGDVIKAKYLNNYNVYIKAYTRDIYYKIEDVEATNRDDLESLNIYRDEEFYDISDYDCYCSGEFYVNITDSSGDGYPILDCEYGDINLKYFIRDYLGQYLEATKDWDEEHYPEHSETLEEDVDDVNFVSINTKTDISETYKKMFEDKGITNVEIKCPIFKERKLPFWYAGKEIISGTYKDKYTVSLSSSSILKLLFVHIKNNPEDIVINDYYELEDILGVYSDEQFVELIDGLLGYDVWDINTGKFIWNVYAKTDLDFGGKPGYIYLNVDKNRYMQYTEDIDGIITKGLENLDSVIEEHQSKLKEGIKSENNGYAVFEPDTKVEEVKELIAEIPQKLYHGTSDKNAELIKQSGGLALGNTKNWSASREDAVYLTTSIDDAYEYCHRVGIDDVTILEIDKDSLDFDYLYVDANEEYFNIEDDDIPEDKTIYDVFNFEYRKEIPINEIVFLERNRNSLTEALSHNILFHRTNPRIAAHILNDNELKVGGNYLFNLNRGQCICFSRDYNFIKNMNKQNYVVFVFNKDKLQTKYKLEPVSDTKNTGNNKARFTSGSKAEEVCFENITNMSDYLYKIVISDEIYDSWIKYLEDNNISVNKDICVKASSYRVNESLSEAYGHKISESIKESLDLSKPIKVYSRGNDKWTTTSLELYDIIEDSGANTATSHDIETRELKLEGLDIYYPFEELDLDLFNQLYDIIGDIAELEEAGIPFEYVEEEPADWALVDFLDLVQHGTDLGYDITIIPVDDEYIIYINDETAFDRKLVNIFEDVNNPEDIRRMESVVDGFIYSAWAALINFANPDLIDEDGNVIEEDAGYWGLKNDGDSLWDYRFNDVVGLIDVLDFEVDYLIEDWFEELDVYELRDKLIPEGTTGLGFVTWEQFYNMFKDEDMYDTPEKKEFWDNHRLAVDILDIYFNHNDDIDLYKLEHEFVGDDESVLKNIFDEEDGGNQDE